MSIADINRNLDKWYHEKRAGVEAIAGNVGAKAERAAKINAKWKDDTGNARQGLQHNVFWEKKDTLKLTLGHTVEYGPYLELANDGKYGILEKTLNNFRGSLYRWIKYILNK